MGFRFQMKMPPGFSYYGGVQPSFRNHPSDPLSLYWACMAVFPDDTLRMAVFREREGQVWLAGPDHEYLTRGSLEVIRQPEGHSTVWLLAAETGEGEPPYCEEITG